MTSLPPSHSQTQATSRAGAIRQAKASSRRNWNLGATDAQRHKLLALDYEPEDDWAQMTRRQATERIITIQRRQMGGPHPQP